MMVITLVHVQTTNTDWQQSLLISLGETIPCRSDWTKSTFYEIMICLSFCQAHGPLSTHVKFSREDPETGSVFG